MKMIVTLFCSGLLMLTSVFARPVVEGKYDSPVGLWVTINTETQQEKSVIRIKEKKGVLYGSILKLLRRDPKAICKKCKGDKLNKPMIGMNVLWGLTYDADENEWSGGKVLHPPSGKIYRAFIALKDNGKRLKVRGYIGFALLGRTQYWYRIKSPNDVKVVWKPVSKK